MLMLKLTRSSLWAVAVGLLLSAAASSHAQLRIVNYNTLTGGPDSATEEEYVAAIFQGIADESRNGISKRPDIIALQEQGFSGGTSSAQDIAGVLNTTFGVTSYQASSSAGGSPFQLAYVYDSSTVDLLNLANVAVGVRPGQRAQWRPVGYGTGGEFYTYNVHFRASDSQQNARFFEAINLRSNADALGEGQSIIYLGDFNFGNFAEVGIDVLTDPGNGQAFDPLELTNWPTFGTQQHHTQSTRTTSLADGGASGGMDDRFDIQYVTGEVMDGEGLSYLGPTAAGGSGLEHSYYAFGNDDVPLNAALNYSFVDRDYSNAEITALYEFSDHLPVVADYQLPALVDITVVSDVPAFSLIAKNATVDWILDVENDAPNTTALASDELDYTFSFSQDEMIVDSGSGEIAPQAAGDQLTFTLDTSTTGVSTIGASVSPEVGSGGDAYDEDRFVLIVEQGSPSFDDTDPAVTTLDFDFGTILLNDLVTAELFSVFNVQTDPTQFGIDLDGSVLTGSSLFTLTGDTVTDVLAGGSTGLSLDFDSSTLGIATASFEIATSDIDTILGGGSLAPLTVTGSAVVAGAMGDFNLDGLVTIADIDGFLAALADSALFFSNTGIDGVFLGDFNNDNLVTIADIDGFLIALAGTLSAEELLAAETLLLASVPEPNILGVLLVFLSGTLAVRRRG
ncbi:MAG: hypothetical protein AAF593_02350 [Planctomycetota bacterium]